MLGASLTKQTPDAAIAHKNRSCLQLSAYILITSIILYSPFIFGDKVLSYGNGDWGYDTFHQYVPVYEFFANAVKNGTLFKYMFQYGLGSSAFGNGAEIAKFAFRSNCQRR